MQTRTVQRAQGDENKVSGYGYGLCCAEGYDTPQRCPEYDTNPSDGEVPAMLELWGMWSTSSLPLLPCPLRILSGTTTPGQSMGQVELFDHLN